MAVSLQPFQVTDINGRNISSAIHYLGRIFYPPQRSPYYLLLEGPCGHPRDIVVARDGFMKITREEQEEVVGQKTTVVKITSVEC